MKQTDYLTRDIFFFVSAPRHLVGNLPPYTNVSLKMILTNPEGRKESDETVIQTDEDGKCLFLSVERVYRYSDRLGNRCCGISIK